jgi:hypothetical protein
MPTAQLQNKNQPDITYLPDHKKWQARTARRLEEEDLTKELPEGFPKQLTGPKIWEGKDFEGKEEEWVYNLTANELEEIDQAVYAFENTGNPLGELRQDTFVLPTLGPKIKSLTEENVVSGRGFLVVRGINPDKFSREQQAIAYAGVSTYVGRRGLQGRHVLGMYTCNVLENDDSQC